MSATEKSVHTRRSYHRISTRKSRLLDRLCEEIAFFEIEGAGMSRIANKDVSYHQQFLTAELLYQQGHRSQSIELARRILHRATGAGQTTMILLAGDLIRRFGGQGSTPLRQRRFVTEQRAWSDADHRARHAALIVEELLVANRHRTDAVYLRNLNEAENVLCSFATAESDESIDSVTRAIVVQRLLKEGRSAEVYRAASIEQIVLRMSRQSSPSWMEVWCLSASVRALTALGLFEEVLTVTRTMPQGWLQYNHLTQELFRHRLLAAMRSGDWVEACRMLVELRQRTDGQTDTIDRERCAVLGAYLQLACELHLCPIDVPCMPHRKGSLLDSISVISEDRKGLGALVLIYDAIDTFLHGDPEVTERKVLNMQVYASRNLRGPGTEALRAFIRFLRLLFVQSFSFIENPQRARKYTDAFTAEFENGYDQSICPLDLASLALVLIDTQSRRNP